jgi:hypothetical protein
MSNGNPTPTNQQAIIATAGGALGGFCSVLYSLVTKQPLFDSLWLSVLVSIPLGVFAALVAVFLTNKINRQNVVTLFVWAMVFGFVWRPVVDGTGALSTKIVQNFAASTAKQLAADNSVNSAKLQPGLSAADINPKIDSALASAVKSAKTLPDVKDEKTKDQVKESLVDTANRLQEVAVKGNDPEVAERATDALKILGETTAKTESHGVANVVSQSLNNVAYTAKDRKTREQAWTSKQNIDVLNVPAATMTKP